MLLLLFSIVAGILFAYAVLQLSAYIQSKISFLNDPVYVPSTPKALQNMLTLAQPKKGQKVIDFGSGDGRLVIAFAQKGCPSLGYEIDPFLVLESRWKIRKAGVGKLAKIKWGSFWSADLSECDILLLYTADSIMTRLSQKIKKEAGAGTKIICQRFPLPRWKAIKQVDDIYLYTVEK